MVLFCLVLFGLVMFGYVWFDVNAQQSQYNSYYFGTFDLIPGWSWQKSSMMYATLPYWHINQFKLVKQRRQQVLRA